MWIQKGHGYGKEVLMGYLYLFLSVIVFIVVLLILFDLVISLEGKNVG